jgi:hypothetical protein
MDCLFPRMKHFIIPASILATAASVVAAQPVEFNRDIRPILTHHCTGCHGGVKEAGGVSYITREGALATGESGRQPVVPGDPAKSEMLRRIRSTDPDEVMPQPKHGPPLSVAEASLIERWIAEGAKWQKHWSHEAPVEPAVPKVSDENWPASPLDRFVMARLDREKLRPSPEAPAAEWLRRASFDLTGLPPTPEELAAFESAHAADPAAARGQAVDRLLTSPRYGERWAAMWLDLARYADTYGFEKDPHRNIWPWRDWVIRAFNSDMPFDQFTIEQLAGDLLPNATADQRLATAFHRNTQCNTEGGTDDEEFRVAAVLDRVSTTWTTWQATTFGCVQCHSHPYDPIDHREFYQFSAFFDNTLDCDQDDDFPRMKIANDPAQRDELSDLETRIRDTRLRINRGGQETANATTDWQPFLPDTFAPSHGTLAVDGDGTIRSQGTLPTGCQHEVSGPAPAFTALRVGILPDSSDPLKWPERGSLVTRIDVRLIDAAGKSVPVPLKDIIADHLDGPHDPAPGGNFGGFPKLEGPRWFVIVPATPVTPEPGSRLGITLKNGAQTTGNQATPVRNFRVDVSNSPGWTALAADPGRAGLWQSLAELKKQHAAIPGTPVPVMVERHDDARRETRIFARGNRLTKDEAVQPGIPAIFQSPAKDRPEDRLGMARWLVSKENPLTARVLANRLWGELFGTGIVRTMEDLGTSGEVPSHPELLDHLALRLRDHHRWSVKAMLREMVLSSTYRQSHKATPELVALDRDNRLLARGPRVRLTAEMVRDQALAAAGLLSEKMFGPPVYPPQPDGVWSSVYSGASWKESTGEDRYRRGIYTYAKRTSGFPGFLTFDAPSRDLCSARRVSSNTPLQALVTLNDPAHIEAAQALAKRMESHHPESRQRIAFGVRLATQQTATNDLIDELVSLHADASAAYTEAPEESAKLGPTPAAAALVLVANTLLNLDSALNR